MNVRVFIFLLLSSAGLCAQANESLLKSVKLYAEANEDKDWKKVLELTSPRLIDFIGGEQKMLSDIKRADTKLKNSGLKLVSFELSQPLQEYKTSEGDIFCAVPARLCFKGEESKLYSEAPILAISSDEGLTWTFISVAEINRIDLVNIFPKFPKEMKLPLLRVYTDE